MSTNDLRVLYVEDEYYIEPRETITVHVEDAAPVDTGLVDEHGVRIMRTPNRSPMGFCR